MGVVYEIDKSKIRKDIYQLLKKMGEMEGIQYGSVRVEFALEFNAGKPKYLHTKDPFEHSITAKDMGI